MSRRKTRVVCNPATTKQKKRRKKAKKTKQTKARKPPVRKITRPASPAKKGRTMAKRRKKGSKKGLTAKQLAAGFGGKGRMRPGTKISRSEISSAVSHSRPKRSSGGRKHGGFKKGHKPWNKGRKNSHWHTVRTHSRRTNPMSGMNVLKVIGGFVGSVAVGAGADLGLQHMGVSNMTRAATLLGSGILVGGLIALLGAPVAGMAVTAGLGIPGAQAALVPVLPAVKSLKGIDDLAEYDELPPGIDDAEAMAMAMSGMGAVHAELGAVHAELGGPVRMSDSLMELGAVIANDMGSVRRMYGDRNLAELLRVS